jgi:hypothetical protein
MWVSFIRERITKIIDSERNEQEMMLAMRCKSNKDQVRFTYETVKEKSFLSELKTTKIKFLGKNRFLFVI